MPSYDHMVLLYDAERYAGENRAPGYQLGMVRFSLTAFTRSPGAPFHRMIWAAAAVTLDEARAKVPTGGTYFDRSKNWPSPMVPLEGWYFDSAPSEPPERTGPRIGRADGDVAMKLTERDAKLVTDAVIAVKLAKQRGDKRITLHTPPGWTLGDDAFEEAVVRELSHSVSIVRVYEQ